jgi:hypothetical protein
VQFQNGKQVSIRLDHDVRFPIDQEPVCEARDNTDAGTEFNDRHVAWEILFDQVTRLNLIGTYQEATFCLRSDVRTIQVENGTIQMSVVATNLNHSTK